MSGRMTDERLAELREDLRDGITEKDLGELLVALQAERDEVERLEDERDAVLSADHERMLSQDRVRELCDSTLAQPGALANLGYTMRDLWNHDCAMRMHIYRLRAERDEAEAELRRLRRRLNVLDRQEWFRRSLGEAGSSEGWVIEVPETDDAAADLRLLLGLEDGA